MEYPRPSGWEELTEGLAPGALTASSYRLRGADSLAALEDLDTALRNLLPRLTRQREPVLGPDVAGWQVRDSKTGLTPQEMAAAVSFEGSADEVFRRRLALEWSLFVESRKAALRVEPMPAWRRMLSRVARRPGVRAK